MGMDLDAHLKNQLTQCSSMMFNTGDIVRWQEDGSLEIFGRKDQQVKIKVGHLWIFSLQTLTYTSRAFVLNLMALRLL